MTLTILFLIMIGIFVGYVSFIWAKYGVLKSISESYYSLPKKINFLFTFFCWGFAIPAIIIGTALTDNFLMFLAGSGIAFVGAAAAMRSGMTRTVHMIGAFTGVILSQLSICIDFDMWYITAIFVGISLPLLLFKVKNYFWWVELLAFISISIVLGISLL